MRFNKIQQASPFRLLACVILVFGLPVCVQQCVNAQSNPSSTDVAADVLPVVSAQLSLADALHLAGENNVELQQERATSESARADAESASSSLRPSISTTTYATTGDESSIVSSAPGVMPQNIFGVPRSGFADQDLMLMAPLSTGGTLQKRAQGAARAARGSALDVDAARLRVDEAVTQAYVNVLLQNALVSSAQARLTAEEEQVRITQQKVNTGGLAPVDLLREQAELADAQSGLTQANVNADLAIIDLKTDIGVSQTSTISLTDTLDTLAATTHVHSPATLAEAITIALDQRPEISAAQDRVNAAMSQLGAARGQYAPQVYGIGMADAMAGQDIRGSEGYTVGLVASVPLYDGGTRKANNDSASAALDRADADAKAASALVEKDVAQAWYSLQTAQQQVVSAQAEVTAAQQAYDLADLRYNAGKSTTAERLDALATMVRANASLAQAEGNLVVSLSGIELVEGNPRQQ
jgi:outer membrane protein TolC